MSFQRYVAVGDSFTEGVGDPSPGSPNGLRGWADRVAEVLAAGDPGFQYANLAVRGRKLDGVIAEQLEPAIAMGPDLITSYAGANDIMRPKVDLDGVAERYHRMLERLAATGAKVLVFTAFDPGGSSIYRPVRGRFALYNEAVRWSADALGLTLVDYWRLREYRDWGYWDTDRMHMGPAGHQRMAIEVLNVLGVEHDLEPLSPRAQAELTARQRRAENLAWTRQHAVPWVQRRLTGRSSGDTVQAKWPTLGPYGRPQGEDDGPAI